MARSHAGGFALVETLVAVTLIAGAVATFAQLIAAGASLGAASRHRTLASLIARQEIERLRSETAVVDGAGREYRDGDGRPVCGTSPCGAAVFSLRRTIAPVASAPALALVAVEVSHLSDGGAAVRSIAVRPRLLR